MQRSEIGRLSTVNALGSDLQLVSDSQDVQAIRDHIGGTIADDYDAFFVSTADGDYSEVWGMVGVIPYLSKLVTRLV